MKTTSSSLNRPKALIIAATVVVEEHQQGGQWEKSQSPEGSDYRCNNKSKLDDVRAQRLSLNRPKALIIAATNREGLLRAVEICKRVSIARRL